MVLSPRLDLRQTQQLVMTPQLQQAIKLLQLSHLDLSAYVDEQLEQNPLLERDEGPGDGAGGSDNGSHDVSHDVSHDGGGNGLDRANGTAADEWPLPDPGPLQRVDAAMADDAPTGGGGEGLDVDYDNVWNNDAAGDGGGDWGGLGDTAFADWGARGGGFDGGEADLEQMVSGTTSLRDYLAAQVSVELTDPTDRLIAGLLVETVNPAGYVTGGLDDIAHLLGCGVERVEQTLARVQQFDPPGIFARDLAECLAIQLRERDRFDPAMAALLENLDRLARREFDALCRVCGVDREDLADMVAEIRALNPKPAASFDVEPVQPVTPDVLMRPHPSGGWIIELNNDTLPRVLVNHHYHSRVSQAARSKDEKQFINECFQSANWLVKSLHQRATTILKVATELVRQQDGFFTHGVQGLRPLVLRDIATAIEMHESTVSRVTSNKYIATPRGIFELKYFFTTAIGSATGGDAYSAEAVRHRIKALIDAEDPRKVLSDDKLVDTLQKEGIDIARRTVAKYREGMGIASSVQRRREKKASL